MSTNRPAHVWAVVWRDSCKIVWRWDETGQRRIPAAFYTKRDAREYIDLFIDRWRIVKLTEGAS